MNNGCCTLDIEIHDKATCSNGIDWVQRRFLVHGSDDVLWTDDIEAALSYLREEMMRLAKPIETERK